MNGNGKGATALSYLRGETNVFAEREKLARARKKMKRSGLSYWLCCPNERRLRVFWGMVSLLAKNSRMSLTEISRRLDIPVSSAFDMLRHIEKVFSFTLVLKEQEKQTLEQLSHVRDEFVCDNTEDKVLLSSEKRQSDVACLAAVNGSVIIFQA